MCERVRFVSTHHHTLHTITHATSLAYHPSILYWKAFSPGTAVVSLFFCLYCTLLCLITGNSLFHCFLLLCHSPHHLLYFWADIRGITMIGRRIPIDLCHRHSLWLHFTTWIIVITNKSELIWQLCARNLASRPLGQAGPCKCSKPPMSLYIFFSYVFLLLPYTILPIGLFCFLVNQRLLCHT